jgi:hypothetical protein
VTWVIWSLVSIRLDAVLVLVQDRCTVYTKHIIGLEIILDAHDGTPRRRGSSGGSFGPVWIMLILMQDECTVCAKCAIGSEIVLDTPNRTPR